MTTGSETTSLTLTIILFTLGHRTYQSEFMLSVRTVVISAIKNILFKKHHISLDTSVLISIFFFSIRTTNGRLHIPNIATWTDLSGMDNGYSPKYNTSVWKMHTYIVTQPNALIFKKFHLTSMFLPFEVPTFLHSSLSKGTLSDLVKFRINC